MRIYKECVQLMHLQANISAFLFDLSHTWRFFHHILHQIAVRLHIISHQGYAPKSIYIRAWAARQPLNSWCKINWFYVIRQKYYLAQRLFLTLQLAKF